MDAGVVEKVGVPTRTNVTGLVAALPRDIQLSFAARLAKQVIENKPPRIGFVTSDYPFSLGDLRMIKKVAVSRGDMLIKDYIFAYREMPEGLEAMLKVPGGRHGRLFIQTCSKG